MFVQDKNELLKYSSPNRLWQGIPSIEVTKKGRIFITFYSGGYKEGIGNFSMLIKSDDNGKTFSEPIAVLYEEGHRYYDPCLWIDPLGRLWFTASYAPEHGVFAYICEDPDSDEITFNEPIKIGTDVMMNKPTVLSNGDWLFPIAIWKKGIRAIESEYDSPYTERKAFAYKTSDCGKSFTRLGGVDIKEGRDFDEHMFLEMEDKSINMYIRTKYGIGLSKSNDNGETFTEGEDSKIKGPCARFFIRRLKSGRILLVNHHDFNGRNNMTALLSEDDAKTWKYSLLLDERNDVSYPDAKEADDGFIYITYDRERGDFENSLDDALSSAREILMAKITEDDIINGEIKNKDSKLKVVASKLTDYAFKDDNMYITLKDFTPDEINDGKKYFVMSAHDIIDDIKNEYKEVFDSLNEEEKSKVSLFICDLNNKDLVKEKSVLILVRYLNSLKVK